MPAKSGTASNQVLYFVEQDHGRAGKAFRETDRDANSRVQLIADIFRGEIERPLTVLEVIPSEHTCRDITDDVARELYAHFQDAGERCPARLRDFFDLCLGVSAADQLDRSIGFSTERTALRLLAAAE